MNHTSSDAEAAARQATPEWPFWLAIIAGSAVLVAVMQWIGC